MNKVCEILNIQYPIIQGGMVWTSGAKLAAAVSSNGGLGVIGAGSMSMDILREQILKAKTLTDKPFAVNFPLLYSRVDEQIEIALELGVDIFITSAGSPKKFTQALKAKGKKVLHVVSSPLLAKKCEDAGVDIVIAEGFEAGGHNGRDEITTLCLIPQTVDTVSIPVIAAGGIADSRGIKAVMALGAMGAQLGTRFLMTKESSAHPKYKELLTHANFDSTKLSIKKHVPVRLFKNKFYEQVKELEDRGADVSELSELLGRGRAKKGMFDGELDDGELEVGQICSLVKTIPSVEEVMEELISAFE